MPPNTRDTLDASRGVGRHDGGDGPPVPGLVAISSGGSPTLRALSLADGPLVLGREGETAFADTRMSRLHAEVGFTGGSFWVRDLGSHNGTFVDGARAPDGPLPDGARLVRVGDTLLLLRADVRPFVGAAVRLEDGMVLGPTLQVVHDEIAAIARSAEVLHLCGETGSGKELAARAFHAAGPTARGPFVAVNCASVPAALAERLLFGARKGAYSGADADADGWLQAADGGTLFLDEIADLPADVQAKLLRVIETRQVTPLGSTQARAVKLRLCSAAQVDLRAAVAAGDFRDDLYYRLARPSLTLPPLRARAEDIPWLIQSALARAAPGLTANVALVEEAVLRPWPGNVRELLGEIGDAARRAVRAGDSVVRSTHLAHDAGMPLSAPPSPRAAAMDAAGVEAALRETHGNVTEAAQRLGLHRNQLRRWLAQNGVDAARFR